MHKVDRNEEVPKSLKKAIGLQEEQRRMKMDVPRIK